MFREIREIKGEEKLVTALDLLEQDPNYQKLKRMLTNSRVGTKESVAAAKGIIEIHKSFNVYNGTYDLARWHLAMAELWT